MTKVKAGRPNRLRKAVHLGLKLLTRFAKLRSMKRPSSSWDEMIHYLSLHHELLKPQQVHSEIRSALEEIERIRPRQVLEVGLGTGGTFFLLSRAVAPEAVLISLNFPEPRLRQKLREFTLSSAAPPNQRLHFIRGDSHEESSLREVKRTVSNQQLDVLFLDGDHTYDGIKKDFVMYAPLVGSGGLVFFHDILAHDSESDPHGQCQVDRFWHEVKTQYRHREFVEDPARGWAGIGMLYM